MRWSALVGALFVFACGPDIEIDRDETSLNAIDGPTVEFDPGFKDPDGREAPVLPFPTDLALNADTGKVDLPEQCNETLASKATRELQLNVLDGFGTWKTPIRITFSETPDIDTVVDNIFLFAREIEGVPVEPENAVAIPLSLIPGTTLRFDNGCGEAAVVIDSVTAVAQDVLQESTATAGTKPRTRRSIYTVAVLDGIRTDDGGDKFIRSFTWALVSQTNRPVHVELGVVVEHNTPLDPLVPEENDRLLDINLLWGAHSGALAFLDVLIGDLVADPATRDAVLGDNSDPVSRKEILLAWDFTTQTVTRPLNASVIDSPAAALSGDAILGLVSVTGGATPTQFLEAKLGAGKCTALPCAAVGSIMAGALVDVRNYSTEVDNPLTGGDKLPGPWGDPLTPDEISRTTINLIAFVPAAPPTTGAAGYPTVIFGHGIARRKEDLFAIGSQLADDGFASVALDWVNHGDRAVQITAEPSVGCSGTPLPTSDPQCFEPIFSAGLSGTRDNLRQSALDASALVEALKACGDSNADGLCPGLEVDATRIGYLGQSIGTFIGALTVAMNDDIGAAVLNAGGAGLIDFIEDTDNLGLRCGIVNALIDAETLPSPPYTKSDLTFTSGTCTVQSEFAALKMAPEWRSSTDVARWILASGDSVNYASRLIGKKILIQEVVDDVVVPNLTTGTLATFAGLTADPAVCATTAAPPTSSLDFTVRTEAWIQYRTLTAGVGCTDGATFSHDSLWEHADTSVEAELATAQMQTDAIAFLKASLLVP